jgi:hypothetical protein
MCKTCSENGHRQTDTIMKYQPRGKRSQGRTPKRILDCGWDRNRSRGLNPCKKYDDDDDDDDDYDVVVRHFAIYVYSTEWH